VLRTHSLKVTLRSYPTARTAAQTATHAATHTATHATATSCSTPCIVPCSTHCGTHCSEDCNRDWCTHARDLTATYRDYCNRCATLQHPATPATHRNTHCSTLLHRYMSLISNTLSNRNTCNTMHHPTAYCHALLHTCNTTYHQHTQQPQYMQHAATRCNTLQHTATHCNTLQHTLQHTC